MICAVMVAVMNYISLTGCRFVFYISYICKINEAESKNSLFPLETYCFGKYEAATNGNANKTMEVLTMICVSDLVLVSEAQTFNDLIKDELNSVQTFLKRGQTAENFWLLLGQCKSGL